MVEQNYVPLFPRKKDQNQIKLNRILYYIDKIINGIKRYI